MTATIWSAGSSPAFTRASFTNASLVSVSSVVPDFETRMNKEWATSMVLSTFTASSGSTLLMKRASIFRAPSARAQFSSARYTARGPKSLPPMPICTTVVKASPDALVISPACTLPANSSIRLCCST